MKNQSETDDKRIEEFLAPLQELQPAALKDRTHTRRPRRRHARVLLVAAIVSTVAAAGALAATGVFGPLHDAEVRPSPNTLTCAGIIGQPTAKAVEYFRSHGYVVSWRFERFGARVVRPTQPHEPTGIEGGRSVTVKKPPRGSILFDVARVGPSSSHRVVATAMSPDDPNAPRIVPPTGCGNSGS